MKKRDWAYVFKFVVVILTAVTAGMAVRSEYEARFWLRAGISQLDAGHIDDAINSLRRSGSWFVPGSTTSPRAFEKLGAIAHDAHNPDVQRAAAIAATERGFSASRSILDRVSGRAEELSRAQAELDARVSPEDVKKSIVEISPPHFETRFQLLAQCMFVGWMGSVMLGIWRSFGSSGAVDVRALAGYVTAWAVFFTCWLVALRCA